MKIRILCVLLAALLMIGVSAMAVSLPALDALSAIATAQSPAPLELPKVFKIVYQTEAGNISLSRGADGNLTYENGAESLVFTKAGDGTYLDAATGETLTFDQVKERIALVWDMIAPHEEADKAAVTVTFDRSVKVADREASRFREAVHTETETGYSVKTDLAVWHTFDHQTGVCLAKETAPNENHDNVTAVFTCVSYEIGK